MKLLTLSIQAFGPYLSRQKIDFAPAHEHGLFLVQGPTGSGKSSLLDALCFCLYGIPSGDKRDLLELRCHLAPEDARTEVELEFMIGGQTYRARRSYTSKKGLVHDHQCMMEILESGTWRALYTKLSQAQEVVASILGLKAEQFRQVILLPQGKFRDFLVASSQDRTEILKTLFNTRDLDRFMEILQARVSELKDLAKEKTARIQAVYQTLGLENPEALASLLESTSARLKDAGDRLDQLRSAAAQARTNLEKARETAQLEEEYARIARVLEELESTRADHEHSVRVLARARKVAPLTARGSEIKNRRQDQSALETRLASAIKAGQDAQERLEVLVLRQTEMQALARTTDSLKTTLQVLADLSGLAGIGGEKRAGLERASRSLGETRTRLDSARSRLAGLEKEYAGLPGEPGLAVSGAGASGNDSLAIALRDANRELRTLSSQGLELLEAEAGETRRQQKISQDLKSLVDKKDSLKESLDRISATREDMVSRLSESHALRLRGELTPGMPCPVCGSLDHPSAQNTENSKAPDSLPDTLSLALKECEEKQALLAVEMQDLMVQEARLVTQAGESADKLGDIRGRLLASGSAWDQVLARFAGLISAAASALGFETLKDEITRALSAPQAFSPGLAEKFGLMAQDLVARQEALAGERRRLSSELETLQLEITTLTQREKELDADLKRTADEASVLGQKIAELCSGSGLSGLLEGLEQPWHLEVSRVNSETASLKKKLGDQELALGSYERDLALSRQALVHEKAGAESMEVNLRQHQALTAGLEAQWLADLEKAGFEGLEDARKAWLPDEAIEKLEAGIKSWEEKFQASRQRGELLKTRLDLSLKADPEELETIFAGLNEELETALKEEGSNASLLRNIQSAIEEEARLSLEFRESEEKLSLHEGLFRLLNGQDNHLRINLERYALSVYLDEVLEEANIHLDRMSRGRYALQRQDEGQDRRKSAGLEIGIMDAYTARFRSCATLSGGESFMAALALALGLSTTVHRRSGGVRLDTLLIDEGFGSLDEEALQDAMAVLSLLKEKGQVVGIISHVRELQERIECQLLVKRSNGGSSIAWAR